MKIINRNILKSRKVRSNVYEFEDLNYTALLINEEEHVVEFDLYQTWFMKDSLGDEIQYRGMEHDIDEVDPDVKITINWEGCCNITADRNIHMCTFKELQNLGDSLVRCRELAAELLGREFNG